MALSATAKEFSADSSFTVRNSQGPRTPSRDTCSHFKSKLLTGLSSMLPKVPRMKKPFRNQPSDAVSVERLLSSGEPTIVLRLQIEVAVINVARTLVSGPGPEGCGGQGLGVCPHRSAPAFCAAPEGLSSQAVSHPRSLSRSFVQLVSLGTWSCALFSKPQS